MKNSPHGQIKVCEEEFIITAAYIGQFNLEGTIIGLKELRNVIESLNGAPFTMLVDDLNVEGGTPEAYAELEVFNQWLNSQKMVAKAMLINSKLQLKIIDTLVESRKVQNIESFTDRKAAMDWLKSELSNKI